VNDDFTTRLQAALGSAYLIQGELGGGGMSRVYLARETALGREVVLKVLPPELTSSVNLDRFRREIQYAAQLQHPHIVPLLNAGESGDLLWYTMPRIPGESLRTVLERRGALPVPEVLQILRDVADALGSAHQRGLVHRDIKPENILLQGEHALVTDFGVAKAISAALPGSGATAVGVAIGTPAYMAPEQVAGDPAADHRIDLYALGLLTYELLTGDTPFRGTSPHQTMAAHLIRQPTPPDTMRAGLPAGLSALVMRCLQKDPAERYPDAAALIHDLRRISEGSGGTITPPATPSPPVRGGRRLQDVLLGAGVVAIVALLAYLALQPPPPPALAGPADSGVATIGPVPPPAAAPTLSLADSLAIAEAVERRLAQREEAAASNTRALLDSIRREITQAVTDSLRDAPPVSNTTRVATVPDSRAAERMEFVWRGGAMPPPNAGEPPPAAGPARVVLMPTDERIAAGPMGVAHLALIDSVTAALKRAPMVEVVSAERAQAMMRAGSPPEVAARSADARYSVTVVPMRRRDSVAYTVIVRDLFSRGRVERILRTPYALNADAQRALGTLMATQVADLVTELQRAPRPPQPPRPGAGVNRDSVPPGAGSGEE